MELKKDLPEIFEEFADARKNSFLTIKELKEKGVPVVGVFCTYLPREIPNAMGAAVVGPLFRIGRDDPGRGKGSAQKPLSANQVQLWIRENG